MADHRTDAAVHADFEAALRLHRQGHLNEAEPLYQSVVDRDHQHFDGMEWLGALYLEQGKIDAAVQLFGEAAALNPGNAAFHDNFAAALLRANKPQDAVAALERSLAINPEAFETWKKLGDISLAIGRRSRAMGAFRQAIDRDPTLRAVCHDTTSIPSEEERNKSILENCRQILARYPSYAPAHSSRAMALLALGLVDEARRAAEQALVIDPTVPAYYHVHLHTGDARRNANALSALEQLAGQESVLDAQDRSTLHFLLARAYEGLNRTDEAFAHLREANSIKRGMICYDEVRELGRLQAIAAAATPARIHELQGCGNPSSQPIFVVGMPRSGTTLVEQILASHPDVYGAGELDTLPRLITDGMTGADYPANFSAVRPDALRRVGETYLARTSAIAPHAKRIVDKHPYNYLHAGLIHLALPRAQIIHVKRDALDTCFSCYSQTFAGEVGFAYDLGELGRYYRAYEALMAHWHRVLPQGAMLEVQYEDLVRDLSGTTQRLLAFCGLDWDARCLEFHRTQRAVVTASLTQVRQPIYQKSVGRAQAYADYLTPLREALGLHCPGSPLHRTKKGPPGKAEGPKNASCQ